MEVDAPNFDMNWGKCLRVRVMINVTKKLIRGKKITIEGGESRWVQLKFERLLNFCYRCDLLNRSFRECPLSIVNNQMGEESFQYGAWLRGEPTRRFTKEPKNHGGGGYWDFRGRAIGLGTKKPTVPSGSLKEKIGKGLVLGSRGTSQGGSGATGEKKALEVSLEKPATLHDLGKASGSVVKMRTETSTLSANFSDPLDTSIVLTEVMQWEKGLDQDMRKAHPKVIPFPTPSCSHPPAVTNSSRLKDEILPGFKGQCRRCDLVTKELNTIEGQEGKHGTSEPTFP